MIARRGPVLAVLAVVLAGCGAESGPSGPPPGAVLPEPVPTVRSTPPAGSTAGETAAVPVYYVADTPAGPRLQREFHRVPSDDRASAAVREMLAEPTGTDPDYHSYWPSGTTLRTPVRVEGATIVVDLAGADGAPPSPELAELTVQQLVFTVQGALQSADPVRILVDGKPVARLWGTVPTAEPVRRGDDYALRSLVQIDGPADGAVVGREVEVTGEAAVFEATVLWQVLRDGAVVRSGVTSTSEGQRFAPFAFTVALAPGDYVVRVLEDDVSGGEGRPVLTDDKSVTVRG
ncbi:GerMN domain-containing protein [Pseudonocardia xinjiangensis]|uniref:GerMN domain-containing protein n=1 Tax=Pseudonocardia xinjiangensis TaxID=75289 RepID=UPI003D9366FF